MSKRKTKDEADSRKTRDGNGDGSSDEDMDILDVDFEFFDPQPAVDFHGLKSLCRQLFDIDAQVFDLSALVDLILSQPTLGSTVKCDGNESDPYAFLTVSNLRQHQSHPAVATIIKYLISRAASIPQLAEIKQVLASSNHEVGLILAERLLNVPPEVIPPMYTMLMEEVEWANADNEPYTFSHYLIISKTYKEVESKLDDDEESRSSKKQKKNKGAAENTFFFHPEDEIFHRFALAKGNYSYTSVPDTGRADSKRAFQDMGIIPQGHMILIERSRFEESVKAVTEFLNPPS